MREIKFRAWDKEEKRFWFFTLQEILERRMHYRGSFDEKILKGEKTQFTGLYDKNGTEIYEGDIIKAYDGYRYYICEVVFYPGAWFGMKCKDNKIEKEHNIPLGAFEKEIIGNKYEGIKESE